MEDAPKPAFKTPVLIGKVGKLPKKIALKVPEPNPIKEVEQEEEPTEKEEITAADNDETEIIHSEPSANEKVKKTPQVPYTEPSWSGVPEDGSKYALEILKQGSIIGNHDLSHKSYWIFGRLPQCDISMAHPTISRYHAVLQYRKEDTESEKRGYYLYDLGSTHGTFLNKLQLQAKKYVRVQVGHMIKLGCSSRSYILAGPDEDQEDESELSVTELKQKRAAEIARREQLVKDAQVKAEEERIAREKREAERGVDWGMGEDADVETDLSENPYAQTNNEDFYIDDPKKALRGFMEREGVDFEYDCTEQGIGQFLCKVVLPIDDERGRSVVAEALHKGKKKEAVAQCALEACRILDRHGVLRQATHESKKRKAKDWQENDFYDSDDDTFLDRTGTIERKRENRMKLKQPQQAETYQTLLEKEKTLLQRINQIQADLTTSQAAKKPVAADADSLDSFMAELKQPKLDKEKIMQLKTELMRLKQDHAQVIKLVNIARPADLPPLTPQYDTQAAKALAKSKFPMFGKRLKVKVAIPKEKSLEKPSVLPVDDDEQDDNEGSVEISHVEESVPVIDNNQAKEETLGREKSRLSPSEVATSSTETTCGKATKESAKAKEEDSKEKAEETAESKRKKNLRRIAQREEKLEKEKQRGYEEDFRKEDYNMWVPPENQTGDGKTSLNDKFGY